MDSRLGDWGMLRAVLVALLGCTLFISGGVCAFANGANENGSWQFRSANDRQVLLNELIEQENIKHNFGVGSSSGLGTQTGNAVSITVGGSNDTVTVNSSNTGDQSISDNMLNE
jgi:VCBS repeat-containing protein